jgi:hypothetical protein
MSKQCPLQSISSPLKRPWIEEMRFFAPLVIGFTLLTHNHFVAQFGFQPPPWLSGVTIFFYVTGTLADIYTTHLCMQFKDKFERNGFVFPARETNWFLPDHLTLRQHLFSLPSLFSILGMFYVFYVPAVGLGASLLHLGASWANLQTHKWLMQTLQEVEKISTPL